MIQPSVSTFSSMPILPQILQTVYSRTPYTYVLVVTAILRYYGHANLQFCFDRPIRGLLSRNVSHSVQTIRALVLLSTKRIYSTIQVTILILKVLVKC